VSVICDAEQRRLMKNLAAEICAVTVGAQGNDDHWLYCDRDLAPYRLETPILPCNFIPVQPRFYTGMRMPFSLGLSEIWYIDHTVASFDAGYALIPAKLAALYMDLDFT
jgi:hypothetical protein